MNKLQQGYENLKRAKDELKKYRKMLFDTCLLDREYQAKHLSMIDMRKALKTRRNALINQSQIEKELYLAEQVRLEKSNLNEWVAEYVQTTKMTSVSIQDSLFDIVTSYQFKQKHG